MSEIRLSIGDGSAGLPWPDDTAPELGFCFVCAGIAKRHFDDHHKAAIEAADASEDRGIKWIGPARGYHPLPVAQAVTVGPAMSRGLSGQIVPLCWTHVPELPTDEELQQQSQLIAGGIPPGLWRGNGNRN